MKQTKLITRWQDAVVFGDDGPQPQKLLETESFRVVLVGLKAGQRVPVHPAPASAYHFLAGSGQMSVDGEPLPVGPGATVVVPSGARRGIEADTEMVFLGSQTAVLE